MNIKLNTLEAALRDAIDDYVEELHAQYLKDCAEEKVLPTEDKNNPFGEVACTVTPESDPVDKLGSFTLYLMQKIEDMKITGFEQVKAVQNIQHMTAEYGPEIADFVQIGAAGILIGDTSVGLLRKID